MNHYLLKCNCIYKGRPNGKKREFYWEEIWSCYLHRRMFKGQKTQGDAPAKIKAKYIPKEDLKLVLAINKMKGE